jgi:DNA mismatch endonuclease (patch repair protein)
MPKFDFKNVSPKTSRTMRAIRGRDTSIEIMVRKQLFRRGLRYRVHYRTPFGTPDIVFLKRKLAVFLDSDFWHGRDLEKRKPRLRNNRDYWISKIERNIERDAMQVAALEQAGWCVIRFWESAIRRDITQVIETILRSLRPTSHDMEPPKAVRRNLRG